jgi:hypothetical protein
MQTLRWFTRQMSAFEGPRSRHKHIQDGSLTHSLSVTWPTSSSISPRVPDAMGFRSNVTLSILPVNAFGDLKSALTSEPVSSQGTKRSAKDVSTRPFATLSDATVRHKFNAYCGRSFRQRLRRCHFVASLAEQVVFIDLHLQILCGANAENRTAGSGRKDASDRSSLRRCKSGRQ